MIRAREHEYAGKLLGLVAAAAAALTCLLAGCGQEEKPSSPTTFRPSLNLTNIPTISRAPGITPQVPQRPPNRSQSPSLPSPGSNADNDRDHIPDGQDPYPGDSDNDGVADGQDLCQTSKDCDGDGWDDSEDINTRTPTTSSGP